MSPDQFKFVYFAQTNKVYEVHQVSNNIYTIFTTRDGDVEYLRFFEVPNKGDRELHMSEKFLGGKIDGMRWKYLTVKPISVVLE